MQPSDVRPTEVNIQPRLPSSTRPVAAIDRDTVLKLSPPAECEDVKEMQAGEPAFLSPGLGHRAAFVAMSLAMLGGSPAVAELRCPPRLPGAHAGFEQVGPIPMAHWLLSQMRLFDGLPGEELKAAPADLAPDKTVERRGGFTSTWSFGASGDLLIVCAYNGSKTYYRARPGSLPSRCTMRNDNGLTQAWCD